MAAHIALHEVGATFEGRSMSFRKNDMAIAGLSEDQSGGTVPALADRRARAHRGRGAILSILTRRFPEAALLPHGDIEAEAQAVSWMSFIASTLHPARQKGLDHARKVYGIADRRLGHGWALGER